MSIASEISRLQSAKSSIRTSIENKGVTVGSSLKLDEYADCIDEISSGGGTYGSVELLIVGGGAGGGGGPGGSNTGGGGGGGGVIHTSIDLYEQSYCVKIGAGGYGGGNGSGNMHYCCDGQDGGFSSFGDIIAPGGGGGGYSFTGHHGGNGGGAGDGGSSKYGGCGVRYNGASTGSYSSNGGGGGGGGGNASGKNGGIGYLSDISGTSTYYAGGGGGGSKYSGSDYCGGCGGCGGGGAGGSGNRGECKWGCPATYYGGGGGGQGGSNMSPYSGGNGYQGIVIVRYPTSCGYNTSGGCKYTCGDYTIHCFTSNGTFTISESQLKEFTEICSIATYTEALTELNKYPQRYYQKFLVEQNIIQYNVDGLLYETLKGIESGGIRYPKYRQVGDYFYMLIYNDNQSQWESLQLE